MSPADDADLLLRIVRRHLQAMRLNLSADYPDEEWGFQAQQALEKLLKAALALQDQQPERTHDLGRLSAQLGENLPAALLALQVFAVEARYEEGPFALPLARAELLRLLEERLGALEARSCVGRPWQPPRGRLSRGWSGLVRPWRQPACLAIAGLMAMQLLHNLGS